MYATRRLPPSFFFSLLKRKKKTLFCSEKSRKCVSTREQSVQKSENVSSG